MLYLNNMRLHDYESGNKKRQCAEKVVPLEKPPIFHIRMRFERDGEQGSSICGGNLEVVSLRDLPNRTSNRSRMVLFTPILREVDNSETALSTASLPRKEVLVSTKDVPSSGAQHSLRFRTMVTIGKTKQLMKVVRQLVQRKRTKRAAHAGYDASRGIDESSTPL